LGLDLVSVSCIILDSWEEGDTNSLKKLKNLCDNYKQIPVIVMQTIDDSKFLKAANEDDDEVEISRDFDVLHLLALPRLQIRKVVSEYNRVKSIGEDNKLLDKLVSDLELLNIHRTPFNCLTLLKVSEKYFDESPVNRTKMLEMVLFILFDMDDIPTYKTRPDLKDCEYVLGRFCENLIRTDTNTFTRESFLTDLTEFCKDKLIDLEVEVVFDVLNENNILIKRDSNFLFRSSFWIFYFGAKRMHNDENFANYIFSSEKYIHYPEIIEFYTGIDRNRADALKILLDDLKEASDAVFDKIGIPENMNPYAFAQWMPEEKHIEKMQAEIGENVLNSKLPVELKDKYADKSYNQIKPYDQSIRRIFKNYSLDVLIQKTRASSRALRNSDYVEPILKKEMFREILRSWRQLSNVIFALTPILADKGRASFDGTAFILDGDFGDTFEERINEILQANPTNIVGLYKNDIFSNKIGPLIYEQFDTETNPLTKHQIALLIIFERPRQWKIKIEEYIVSLPKNSFFLYDTVNILRARYRYDFAGSGILREIEYLVKMGLAKHEFGDKKPGLDKIRQISNENLPKRDSGDQ
jgi:hypothetical protein